MGLHSTWATRPLGRRLGTLARCPLRRFGRRRIGATLGVAVGVTDAFNNAYKPPFFAGFVSPRNAKARLWLPPFLVLSLVHVQGNPGALTALGLWCTTIGTGAIPRATCVVGRAEGAHGNFRRV